MGFLIGFCFDAVFLQESGDRLVFVLNLQGGEVTNHSWTDLVGQLGGGIDDLLLGLELLLLALDGQLGGLDFILLLLETPL